MFSAPHFVRPLLLASLVFVAGCDSKQHFSSEPPVATKSIDDRFAIKVGDRTVQMQLAAQSGEMEKGLMYRQSMGTDEGMLFLYRSPQQMNFWMHNTDLPLDIGYFDASGDLKEIYPMYAHDERTVSSHSQSLQFALEMNQGWYKQTGVKPGAHLDLKAVAEGLKSRGLKPADWGLAE
jgi:uncharacterized membrane protein (UPF0127 family)